MSGEEDRRRAPGSGDRSSADLIYKNVLDNVASGVMSIDADGVITSFNAAAAEICNMTGEAVIGRNFFEVFSQKEGLDEFTDVIFDAVYDSSMVHQRVVEATLGGKTRSLSMATTYLRDERSGETARIGVISLFSDITEIRELRETELRLAREMEAKHAELREAYLKLEETSRKLGVASKNIRVVRTGAVLALVMLFAAIGLYFWDVGTGAGPPAGSGAAVPAPPAPEDLRLLVVEPRRISSTVTILGRLAPRREVEVVSPMQGKVDAVHVRPGQRVAKGQRLLDMDVAEVRISHREAQVAHIKARDRVEELKDWSNHTEVSRARRAVSKRRIALESLKNRLSETAFLLKRGIIPASEHEAAEREHRNQLLDLQAAEMDLEAVLARGAAELDVARLELANARARLKRLEGILSKARVTAPVSGVILHSKGEKSAARPGEESDKLARGAFVERGDLLLTIGDLEGLTVIGHVDEVDVTRIRPGQSARVVGDAFPGVVLRGEVNRVSSQAILPAAGRRGLPTFEVAAVVESLTEEVRRLLRLGMSARVEVVVYEKENALLIPVGAVELQDGRPWLWVRDRGSGEARAVEVVTGMTTVDSVEIIDGISPGDEILIGGR